MEKQVKFHVKEKIVKAGVVGVEFFLLFYMFLLITSLLHSIHLFITLKSMRN